MGRATDGLAEGRSKYTVYADGIYFGAVDTKRDARAEARKLMRGAFQILRILRDGDDWECWRRSPDGNGRRWYRAVP